MLHRRIVVFVFTVVAWAAGVSPALSQTAADTVATDSLAVDSVVADSATVTPASKGPPIFLTLGLSYGRRRDACVTCVSPANTDGFSGHLSLGKSLGYGLGVGVQASVWRHGAPGPLGPADSTGVPVPTTLTNSLGNVSLIFSWQVWHLWVQGGGGVAWAGDDYVPDGSDTAEHASGMGIGYTFGGGAALPLAGPLSLAFFANVNFGRYDLSAPSSVLQRNVEHRYVELGIGLTLR